MGQVASDINPVSVLAKAISSMCHDCTKFVLNSCDSECNCCSCCSCWQFGFHTHKVSSSSDSDELPPCCFEWHALSYTSPTVHLRSEFLAESRCESRRKLSWQFFRSRKICFGCEKSHWFTEMVCRHTSTISSHSASGRACNWSRSKVSWLFHVPLPPLWAVFTCLLSTKWLLSHSLGFHTAFVHILVLFLYKEPYIQ